ncbi:DUF5906 domain-containing protein [Aurantimonas sp. A3-2-R12]|uniref:DUF5906 domain-containing protein n=1 Tax=Aurantimonas sp. A3-2-R12 TaxID=3114362 RepID=UPI002E1790FF|nr:DUF5906 domain-containing protein [Aurantimonas sp. A3-2-R12]
MNDERQWVSWKTELREGKPTKVPYSPATGRRAKSDDPSTWATRAAAIRYASKIKGSIGVMLGDLGNGFHLCGVDLDSCLDGDALAGWAEEVVYLFSTYAEISPSGKGVKLFFLVRDADRESMGPKHRIAFNKGEHCEMALDLGGRYYAVTAEALGDLVGVRHLRVVGLNDLRWLVHVAGPAFAGRKQDESGSGVLYRLARKIKLSGGTKEDFIAAIEEEPDAAAHVAKEGERAIDRAWARAPSPRFDDPDIDDLVGTPPADAITTRVNERFALARHAGRTLVVEFHRDGFHLGGVDDLHTLFANDLVPTLDGKRMEPASRHWLRDPRRRQFSEIVFDPTGSASRTALNLWTGWAVEPDPDASCALILDHIRDVLANGDRAHARYIIGWLADMVQNAGRKPGVALVFKGGKGAGKDTLAVALRRIVGKRHVAHVNRADALTQRFNAPFATAILGHVEEAFWSGAHDKKGTLQSLITSETLPIERKGIDTVTVDSFLRLIMTTNEAWAVPASNDERRYAVFDVSDSRIRDDDYFTALYAEIEGDGPAGFLAHLLDVDLSDFNVRDVPQTEALRDQKLNTLRGVERWWFEFLHKGDIGDFDDWEETVTANRDGIRGRYESFIRENRHQGDAVNSRQFGIELRKMLPSLSETRPRVDGGQRPRFYVFPPLRECRAEFVEWLGAPVDWGDDE